MQNLKCNFPVMEQTQTSCVLGTQRSCEARMALCFAIKKTYLVNSNLFTFQLPSQRQAKSFTSQATGFLHFTDLNMKALLK